MSDLIEREETINRIDKWYGGEHYTPAIISVIEDMPSAERPQGEWIEQDDCWQCSECGDEYVLEVSVKPIDARMHYCPNCGARMKGAIDGNK